MLQSKWYDHESCSSTSSFLTLEQIETLPTRSQESQPLQNVLSISTAGKNRYLFHFNNINSLTQWTAGIRLAMFEHATLQEAYTGSLIAGKGRSLNNIKSIMEKAKFKTEEWTRVRFGAGTPWRRCWCVISPPDEKEIQRVQKTMKKKSAYDRSPPVFRGDIKFYDTKKTKKAEPIATIRDAYSAYAIYPQSKPLIDQSTLVKLEGTITIHSKPEATTEGFVFVMPEVHPAVTGFEMMLRWLFPVYDIFALYGRPARLIADTLDPRSLMFAMPQEKRYGYLEIFDVATLIHTEGSQSWSEMEWRKRLKDLTSQRISRLQASGSRPGSRLGSRRAHRNSLPSRSGALRFEDGANMRSDPNLVNEEGPFPPPAHSQSAAVDGAFAPAVRGSSHQRSASDAMGFATPRRQRTIENTQNPYTPSRLSYEANNSRRSEDRGPRRSEDRNRPRMSEDVPPPPPAHNVPVNSGYRNPQLQRYANELDGTNERSSSESERRFRPSDDHEAREIEKEIGPNAPPSPVAPPPAFQHQPGAKPQTRPYHSPELRRANSRMSSTTLSQLAAAGNAGNGSGSGSGVSSPSSGGGVGAAAMAGAAAAWRSNPQQRDTYPEDQRQQVGIDDISRTGPIADQSSAYEGMVKTTQPDVGYQNSTLSPNSPHVSQTGQPGRMPNGSASISPGLQPQGNNTRNASPLTQAPLTPEYSLDQESDPGSSSRNVPFDAPLKPSPASSPKRNYLQQLSTAVGVPALSDTQRPEPVQRSSTSKSIPRKPIPSPSPTRATNHLLRRQPSADNLGRSTDHTLRRKPSEDSLGHIVDEDALNMVMSQQSIRSDSLTDRLPTMESGVSDYDSNVSPDYASTRQSIETKRSKKSVERPRAGVLKTVGNVEPIQREVVIGDAHYRPDTVQPSIETDIPDVNFGPTQAVLPGKTRTEGSKKHSQERSSFEQTSSPQADTSMISPRAPGRTSPSPGRVLQTPEPGRRSASGTIDENRRSMAWSPGTTIGGGSPGARQSITPEQFVAQRAAANRIVTPVYAHQRQKSSTPPNMSRNSSGDWSSHRASKTDLSGLVRPHSRGASTAMGMNTPPLVDPMAHLSAREQEHVAKVTGGSLVNVAGNKSLPVSSGSGLVGAIEAREREKKQVKQGLGGHMVQQAIAQHQQHAQGHHTYQNQYVQNQLAQNQHAQSQYVQPSPSPVMHFPGQFPQTPQSAHGMMGPQTPSYSTPGWGHQVQQQQQAYSPGGTAMDMQQFQQYQAQSPGGAYHGQSAQRGASATAHPSAHLYWNTSMGHLAGSPRQQFAPQQPQQGGLPNQFQQPVPQMQGQVAQQYQQQGHGQGGLYNPYFGRQ